MESNGNGNGTEALPLTRRQALASAAAAAAAFLTAAAPAPPPNILFILADDLGWADPSCYGNGDFETPNIDRIAREGLRLTNGYANSCICSATRMGLITGRYQYRLPAGLEEPISKGGLPPSHPTLASLLKRRGYRTALVGKWHLGHPPRYGPNKSGYDEFFGIAGGGVDYFTHKGNLGKPDLFIQDRPAERTGYLTDLITGYATSYLARIAANPVPAPFFLSLHYTAPHWPWETEQDAAEAARLKNLFDIDGGSLKTYQAMVRSLDAGIGRVLGQLDKLGLADNTIVVFTSDNGGERFSRMWPLMGEKGDLLEGGIRVPMLIRFPGRVPARTVSDQVAISMDWMPTLLAMAGTAPDPAYPPDGIDLTAALTGGATTKRRLFWRFKGKNQAAVRDGDLKYLRRGKNEFLFDIAEDPRERANLSIRRRADFKQLKDMFAAWNRTMLSDRSVEGYEVPSDWLAF